jgi:tryptophanyl-tRNA synthetase
MIEITREIARDFNRIYGQVFVEPEAKVGSFGRIKGLDGNAKMSKSLNNAIDIKDSADDTAKKIMSAYTDPAKARKDDPGHPDGCMVHAYHQIFTPGHAAIKEECLKGGRGCVVCKKELIANMNGYFAPIRQKRLELGNDLGYVRNVLKQGIIKGQEVSGDILEKAKTAMKIDYRDILGQ